MGWRIWQVFFCVCGLIEVGSFGGIQNNLKILGSADCVVHVISSNPFRKFLRLENSAWDFLVGQFLVQGFFWVLLEALGIFLGFHFCPHSIIPVTGIPPLPLGPTDEHFIVSSKGL